MKVFRAGFYDLQLVMCSCSTKGRASLVASTGRERERRRQEQRWQRLMWQVSAMA